MKELGFEQLKCKWCIVYRRQTPSGTIIFLLHVDDILSAASTWEENERFKAQLRKHWEISDLGTAKFALGIAISRDLSAHTISLSQTALINHVIRQFNMENACTIDTPMVAGLQLC
jgi:hypothetical protein